MEFVMGQIERELRAGEEWWIVLYRGTELMAFETLALAKLCGANIRRLTAQKQVFRK